MAKKYAVSLPSDNFIIMPRTLLDTVKRCDTNQLKLLYWLYAGNEYDASSAAKALSMSPAEADTAAAFWIGAGVLCEGTAPKTAAAPSQSRPTYDATVIAQAIETNDDFRQMCEQLSDIIGKVFNRNDYNTFFYLFDHCGLSSAFIITTAHFCISVRGKKDIRYISGTALALHDDGIDTLDALDKYIAAVQALSDYENRIRVLFGIGERELSKEEKEHINNWVNEWHFDFEMIRRAFETTVNSIGKASFNYMSKILRSWHDNGYQTVNDVIAGNKQVKDSESSFDADEFFTAALNNTMKG